MIEIDQMAAIISIVRKAEDEINDVIQDCRNTIALYDIEMDPCMDGSESETYRNHLLSEKYLAAFDKFQHTFRRICGHLLGKATLRIKDKSIQRLINQLEKHFDLELDLYLCGRIIMYKNVQIVLKQERILEDNPLVEASVKRLLESHNMVQFQGDGRMTIEHCEFLENFSHDVRSFFESIIAPILIQVVAF